MYPAEFLSDPPSTGSAPWKLAFRSSRAFVISVVAIAVFTVFNPCDDEMILVLMS